MTNSILLKQKVKDSGLKLEYICARLNISYNTLKKKLDGEVDFRAHEMWTLCDILNITDPEEMRAIFLAQNVEETSTEDAPWATL